AFGVSTCESLIRSVIGNLAELFPFLLAGQPRQSKSSSAQRIQNQITQQVSHAQAKQPPHLDPNRPLGNNPHVAAKTSGTRDWRPVT
ncbi:hypothetical protein NK214_24925, partial [Chromobacterium sp. S0633]|uniref:hypothetical protein n=1 Tax=Chromobacterium sp. S0633 TaxID=2957805 RepID=UPI00209FD6DA